MMNSTQFDYETFCYFIKTWKEMLEELRLINCCFNAYDMHAFITAIENEFEDNCLPSFIRCREMQEEAKENSFSDRYSYYEKT